MVKSDPRVPLFFSKNPERLMALSKQFLEQQERQEKKQEEDQSANDNNDGVDSSESVGYEYQIDHSDNGQFRYSQQQGNGNDELGPKLEQQSRERQSSVPITPQYLSHTFTPEATKKLVPVTHPKLPSAIMIPEGYELESVEPLVPKQQGPQEGTPPNSDLQEVGSDNHDQEEPTMPVALVDRVQIPYNSVQKLPIQGDALRQGPFVPVITISGFPRSALFERPRNFSPIPDYFLPKTTEKVIKNTPMTDKQKGYVAKVLDNYFKFLTDIQNKKRAKVVEEERGSSEAVSNRQLSKRFGGFWRKHIPRSMPSFINLLVKKK